MMDENEREAALQRMDTAILRFYSEAVEIGVHPFIEFAYVMTAYAKSCRRAHEDGIDFSECNRHSGRLLPVEEFELDYLNEKLECIFTGQVAMATQEQLSSSSPRHLVAASAVCNCLSRTATAAGAIEGSTSQREPPSPCRSPP